MQGVGIVLPLPQQTQVYRLRFGEPARLVKFDRWRSMNADRLARHRLAYTEYFWAMPAFDRASIKRIGEISVLQANVHTCSIAFPSIIRA